MIKAAVARPKKANHRPSVGVSSYPKPQGRLARFDAKQRAQMKTIGITFLTGAVKQTLTAAGEFGPTKLLCMPV